MLYSLIYVSKAVAPMRDNDLQQLLKECKDWNSAKEITGMLLYIQSSALNNENGRFIQVLEGPRNELEILFNKIKNDCRHYSISLLHESSIQKRNFKSWSMGFKSVSLENFKSSSSYFDLDNLEIFKLKPKAFNIPVMYLKSFYDILRSQG